VHDVVLRTDAGPAVGLGHLQRTLALGAALRSAGLRCLLVARDHIEVRARAEDEGISFEPLQSDPDSESDVEQTASAASRVAIVDSYALGQSYLERLTRAVPIVAAIDDFAAVRFPCRLVVNGRPGAEVLPYSTSSSRTRFLLGARYALMRPSLWPEPVPRKAAPIGRVLITLGGSDIRALTTRLAATAARILPDVEVVAVRGPFFWDDIDVRGVDTVHAPHDLRPLMERADIAISAGGHTATELARLGVPTIVVITAQNQEGLVGGLSAAGAVISAGVADRDAARRVGEALRELANDGQRRTALSEAGRRLIDGRGAHRVAEAIVAELDR
jgi:UDP-2,4-diacetamido-2,4,6-trideoxy-beta-L-altropyranose hydrolase